MPSLKSVVPERERKGPGRPLPSERAKGSCRLSLKLSTERVNMCQLIKNQLDAFPKPINTKYC